MENSIHTKAKIYTQQLLNYNGSKTLAELSADTCSEVSRLVGVWYLKRIPRSIAYIAKGSAHGRSHDILIIQSNEQFAAIDPTVWQFFKYRKSIFLGTADSLGGALTVVQGIHGGTWSISEQYTHYSFAAIQALHKTIAAHMREIGAGFHHNSQNLL